MGLFRKPQRQEFPALPDNMYFAKVAKIASKVGKQSGKPYLSWGFEIVQPPHQKRWVWGNTQPTISPKSTTGKFLIELDVDINTIDADTFNEQALIGRYVKVLVKTTENEEGDKFQNVTELLRIHDSEQPLLQTWLATANVKGPVQVASAQAPVYQPPVLAAAPVSFPAAPTAFPGVTSAPATVVTPVVAAPVAPVQQPALATSAPKAKFPF
jgi:hypothetical protein